MRQLAIAVLGFWLAAASAQAQDHPSTYGSFAPNMTPPKHIGSGTFAPLNAPEPYRAHAAPRATISTPASPKLIGSTESFGGGKPYKPFRATSVYDAPKPSKPVKPKSVYDH